MLASDALIMMLFIWYFQWYCSDSYSFSDTHILCTSQIQHSPVCEPLNAIPEDPPSSNYTSSPYSGTYSPYPRGFTGYTGYAGGSTPSPSPSPSSSTTTTSYYHNHCCVKVSIFLLLFPSFCLENRGLDQKRRSIEA